jgi:hypothetical protein
VGPSVIHLNKFIRQTLTLLKNNGNQKNLAKILRLSSIVEVGISLTKFLNRKNQLYLSPGRTVKRLLDRKLK